MKVIEPKKIRNLKLKDIAHSIQYGYTTSADFNINTGYKFLRITDIQEHGVNWETVPYAEGLKDPSIANKYLLNSGDIVFARTGATTGKSFLITECNNPTVFASYLIRVKPDNSIIDSKYLNFFFQSPKYWAQIEKNKKGAAQAGINASVLGELDIPVVSMEDQLKVVDILERASSLIIQRKVQLSLLSSLIDSVFFEMFGDLNTDNSERIPLAELVEVDSKIIKSITDFGDFRLVGIDNIEKNSGKLINLKTVEESNVSGTKYFFNSDHIIYSKIRPYLNKVAIPDFEGLCSTDAYPLKINNKKTNKYFIAFILRSDSFVNYAVSNSKGANIPRIDKKQLLDYRTVYPKIELQNKFGERYEKIQAKIDFIEFSLVALENNFNSLMQLSFNGELLNSK